MAFHINIGIGFTAELHRGSPYGDLFIPE
jgi:hypothetical protein